MLKDLFEIEYAYLKSRWRRINVFMQKYHQNIASKQNIGDLTALRNEFSSINRNYLEPAFSISKNNTWHKILDKNIQGKEAYMGFFREECMDEYEL